MTEQADLRRLALLGIARRCEQETNHFFQRKRHDPRFCFELFRRAIVDRSQDAWALAYTQYRPLLSGWVERHSAFEGSGEETQYYVNRAFEKMWTALAARYAEGQVKRPMACRQPIGLSTGQNRSIGYSRLRRRPSVEENRLFGV